VSEIDTNVASVGLYGVMSYSVSQRTREFGIRMTIGASRGAIVQLVLVNAAKLVAVGICTVWWERYCCMTDRAVRGANPNPMDSPKCE
jgi:hypothetical protein